MRPVDDEQHALFEYEATNALRSALPPGCPRTVAELMDEIHDASYAKFVAQCMDVIDTSLEDARGPILGPLHAEQPRG